MDRNSSLAAPALTDDLRKLLLAASDEARAAEVLAAVGLDPMSARAVVREWRAEQAARHGAPAAEALRPPKTRARPQRERVGLLAQRVTLGSLLRDGVPDPTFLPSPSHGERLFYEGHVFLFAGHKKAGKSWSMILQARDLIAAGRPVVYVDNENGGHIFAERLAAAGGVTPNEVDEYLFYVPFPRDLRLDALREEFDAIRTQLPGAFVVIDSLRSLMARFGLNPEKNVEVERVFGPLMASVKSGDTEDRITVGVIDHANRATREGDAYVASGAAAKAQAVDAVYFFDKIEPFSRDTQGAVKVAVKDDRRGLLDFERVFRVGGQGEGQPFRFERASAEDFGTNGRILLDVRQHMMDTAGSDQTKTGIRTAVKGDNGKVDKALAVLVSSPGEPVWSEERAGGRIVYVWEEREVSDGLPL
jgi:hypothetical protein